MAVSYRLVYSLCFVANIVLLFVTSTNLRFKYSVSNWRKCDTGNDVEFLMLRAIPIQKCIFECQVRGRCKAVKFLTIRRECGLLETDANMAIDYNTRPCVFIRMADVKHNMAIPDNCNNCSPKQVCNIWNKTCTFEECERLTVPLAYIHVHVLGNMQSVESKVKIVPYHCYPLGQYTGSSRCNNSGHWDNIPEAKPIGDGDSETACSEGWTSFEGHCYLFVNEACTFEEAENHCLQKDSQLLEITNAIENEFINCHLRDLIDQTTGLWWLGITDEKEETVWRYKTTGTTLHFTDWHSSQPNRDGEEDCGVLYSYGGIDFKWFDFGCSRKGDIVCKKKWIQ